MKLWAFIVFHIKEIYGEIEKYVEIEKERIIKKINFGIIIFFLFIKIYIENNNIIILDNILKYITFVNS